MSSHPIHRLLPFHILQLIVGVANYFDHPPALWSHPRWIQFWANVSRISWNVPMSWTARDDPSPKCLYCSCSPNPCSGNCASHALKDVWDAGIKICRFATTCFFQSICPLPLKINVTLTCLWRLWLIYDQGFDWRYISIGHVVLHGEMLSYQSQIHLWHAHPSSHHTNSEGMLLDCFQLLHIQASTSKCNGVNHRDVTWRHQNGQFTLKNP